MGPAHGQAPPKAAQGVQRSQSSQVLSFTRTSADLVGSLADETAELQYWVGSMADFTSSDWAGSMADETETKQAQIKPDLFGSMADEAERLRFSVFGQMADETEELSLTTPVLFYGKCKDGKRIPPNAFLMELEARHTRHGWEPRRLLRFVKSCLRGEAAPWWEGCFLTNAYDEDQGPAENYAKFKETFRQQ
jgi:hypothetical protein